MASYKLANGAGWEAEKSHQKLGSPTAQTSKACMFQLSTLSEIAKLFSYAPLPLCKSAMWRTKMTWEMGNLNPKFGQYTCRWNHANFCYLISLKHFNWWLKILGGRGKWFKKPCWETVMRRVCLLWVTAWRCRLMHTFMLDFHLRSSSLMSCRCQLSLHNKKHIHLHTSAFAKVVKQPAYEYA